MKRLIVALFVALLPTAAFGQETVVAAAATFDQLQREYQTTVAQIRQREQDRAAAAAGDRATIEAEIDQLRDKSERLVDNVVAAALDVYRADPKGYPRINQTLEALGRFFVAGDQAGDGGDQHERALPILTALVEGGAADESPDLFLYAGLAAYSNNNYDQAEQYFASAKSAGQLGSQPPIGDTGSPLFRVWDLAVRFSAQLKKTKTAWEKEQRIREAEAVADDLPRVKLVTNRGEIVIELFENEAPQTVANLLTLVKQGFYTDVPFHRVLPNFMAQGGDPTGTGGGGPGWNIRDEHNYPNIRRHFRGSLSMANTGQPNTGGSQFFLAFVPTSYLDGRHTVFGRVIEGMDVATSLRRRDPDPRIPGRKPTADKILSAEVLRDRGHGYEFEKLPDR